ncbi:histone-lysine N-methyltransferase SETMAR [Trichonephila clavata]|uniref:Histone-lysine N-methyltransferase SETMAR n=1 Tax=Trichonephila clavata TaxID=2740835 RepID=A0A8X6KW19_TRICU|nr:histone-lysine N-methyltransferase SETMAR [Trichonephila clavata]
MAIDEFWAPLYEPELKRQSAEWRLSGLLRRQKVHQNLSLVKLMAIVTYDVRGVIVCHFVPHGRTVTAHYRDFLVRQVRRGVRDKRPDLVDSAIILHDNARTHKAERYATREDIANSVRQQATRFTYGGANAEADGIQRLPHRWKSGVIVEGATLRVFSPRFVM